MTLQRLLLGPGLLCLGFAILVAGFCALPATKPASVPMTPTPTRTVVVLVLPTLVLLEAGPVLRKTPTPQR